MSGIIGYIGDTSAVRVILDGLRRLEYRGYDSAGLATVCDGELFVCRQVGTLDQLDEQIRAQAVPGSAGIGHIRWATHGVPAHENTHPHTDAGDRIAVVHNGIVENYAALKKKLSSRGVRFRSETDSEIIAQLIGFYLKRGAETLEHAVHCALMDLKGNYAIAVLDKHNPEKLLAARSGSPMMVGIGEREMFVTSDAPAIIPYTRRVIFLDDYQVAVVGRSGAVITNLSGNVVDRQESVIDWDVTEAQKEGYPYFMLKEIHEQPRMIKKILLLKLDFKRLHLKLEELQAIKQKLSAAHQIIIQACGSSYHAGLIGREIFEYFSGIHTDVEVSSEFRYRDLTAGTDCLVLSISQSGESGDTLAAVRRAKQKGMSTLSLCNVVGSSISRESDSVLYLQAGPEIGVASTKSFTAQLFNLYLIAIFLGMMKRIIKRELKDSLIKELTFIPSLLKKVLGEEPLIEAIAHKYAGYRDIFCVGRGINYPCALEGAHKLREIAGEHASAYPAGELKHGPIALVDETVACVCIAPKSQTYDKMVSTMQKIRARNGRVIAIAGEGDEEIGKYADDVIFVPVVQEIFSPLVVSVALQLFAYHFAVKRGREIDRPKHLAKSVMVE
ncbi:MAG: glutamine--fructose-6-phosphate transaminase (isomerizing) [Candidatus Omnitrophica bacterium]|nr:glutamine--fructose-6-phosphate transaminase (isomerizing) [Candidatus Omnitrophota bacterium]